jgi:hypothetical protein
MFNDMYDIAHLQLLDSERALLCGNSLILHLKFDYPSLFEHLVCVLNSKT